ncbi:hypothetical protein [Alkaliphilus peptidifermentans]|uniref:SmpA / OmlA family protein n=1 Tax=Alkaliphilus peptidifermentans DSM 18978 TaxID=1120976 RepID=A0A1G5C185_9FIRM|nr:hypothetical protein [Alkaliphilus peptidifermentans]SCX96215.1 hypothetical protein SAMN03080606_00589 [Alkaliphilus peptidifermentans DSM 18978]
MSTNRKKYIAVLSITIILSLLIWFSYSFNQKHTFSSEKWLSEHGKRVNIVDDLLENSNLIGMSKTEIIELLGEENGPFYRDDDNIFAYYLGYERVYKFMSNFSKWLIITFSNDKVISYEIIKY